MEYDIIIVGAGTAGLSAAIYGLRAGKKVLVLEQNVCGGQIVVAEKVENYPGISEISGAQFAVQLYEQARKFGAEFVYGRVERIEEESDKKRVIAGDREWLCKALILATGVKKRLLGVAKEKELTGKGVSYCATCDGAFFSKKDVMVVGGGNTALSDALFLSNYCKTVTLVHRRSSFRAEETLVEKVKEKENISLCLDSRVSELCGEQKLSAVVIENSRTGEKRTIDVEGIFVAIGQIPDSEAFADIVRLDKDGYIIASEDCHTNTEGIFAAGDCRTKEVRQLTTAASDGAVAALAAVKWCR